MLLGELQRLGAVAGLGDHDDVRITLEQTTQDPPEAVVIVGQEHTHHRVDPSSSTDDVHARTDACSAEDNPTLWFLLEVA